VSNALNVNVDVKDLYRQRTMGIELRTISAESQILSSAPGSDGWRAAWNQVTFYRRLKRV